MSKIKKYIDLAEKSEYKVNIEKMIAAGKLK